MPTRFRSDDAGFTLVESLLALGLLLIVSSIVSTGLIRMTEAQGTIWNRSEMHAGVRSATELLQQEVGQAGLVTLPAPVTLTAPVAITGVFTATVNSTAGMFANEQLTVDTGNTQETVTVMAVNGTTQFTAFFVALHPANAPVTVLGGFANGILPTNVANGSTATVLKMFGDINGDGSMVYIEYTCDTAGGNLFRNMMPFNAAVKTPAGPAQVLLSNIVPNPGGAPCFTYEQKTVGAFTYVIDVAITLTVRTQQIDPVTKQFQTETKALLNVSPRNVFNAWELASAQVTTHVQPTPASVQALLQ
jgi:prepilin-type N-terminal cleavage/methylation domain-containing protein